jgi:hypothetical protein
MGINGRGRASLALSGRSGDQLEMIASTWRWPAAAAAAVFAVMVVASPMEARAGEIADRAAEAERLLGENKAAEAQTAFDKAAAAFWIASPLQLRVVTFADEVKGFGNYTPHAGTSFKPGDTLLMYFEPIGYAFAPDGDIFKIVIVADVEIHTPGGLILAKSADFGRLEWSARSKTREVHATLKLPLPKLKPGDYQLLVTLRDQGSPKTAAVTLPFSIAE